MSMLKNYEKKLTPCGVKSKERADVDITRLVKHGAHRLVAPRPTYADLTQLPESRGEAAARILTLTEGHDDEIIAALLKLPPEQANQAITAMFPPAPKRDDKTTRKEQGEHPIKPTPAPEPAK